MLQPEYVCAIIRTGENYLFEQRGADAQFAAGRLTCFGGRRNPEETNRDCLLRELQEELQWQPAAQSLQLACTLWKGERFIAEFYNCVLDVSIEELTFETGRTGILIHQAELSNANLSPWHRAIFDAVAQGSTKAIL